MKPLRDEETRVCELAARVRTIARAAARRYRVRDCDRDDIESDALWGLLRALRSYEPGHGQTFSAWLERRVQDEIREGLRRRDPLSRGERARRIREGIPLVTMAELPAELPGAEHGAAVAAIDLERLRRLAGLRPRWAEALRLELAGVERPRIARRLGVGEPRVSQIIATAVRKMAAAAGAPAC